MIDKKTHYPQLAKIEGNLAEYPFFQLSKKGPAITTFKLAPVTYQNTIIAKRELSLINSNTLPTPFDLDVLIAILTIGTRDNTLDGDIHFTCYEIAKMLDSVTHRDIVKKSIKKLASLTYESKLAILLKDKDKRYYIEDVFHILDNASFLDEEEKNKRKSREITKVRFNKYFIQNFANKYFKYINFETYKSLQTPLAKRLYLFLEKKKFEKRKFEIKLEHLANILPLHTQKLFKIRAQLKSACSKLIEKNIIENYEYTKDTIIFHFPKVSKIEKELIDGSYEKVLYQKLIDVGVSKNVALELVKEYPNETIENQLKYLKFRKADEPSAVLVKSIREDWAPPKDYIDEEKIKREQEEKIRKEIAAEELEKKIKEIRSKLSPQELDNIKEEAKKEWEETAPDIVKHKLPTGYVEAYIKKVIKERYLKNDQDGSGYRNR